MDILYRDADLVVVNKPSGLMVHRSALDRTASEYALQMVRDQLGQYVYPVHRLDRGTSGALIFALSVEAARAMMQLFASGEIAKSYWAVVRGIPPDDILVDYPLRESDSDRPAQSAVTRVETRQTCAWPERVDKYPTSWYALVKATPKTGRNHQIRRHLRHLGHPIIGDITYGSGKHNRFFASRFGVRRLLLACTEVAFRHPLTGQMLRVQAPLADDFATLLQRFNWTH